MRHLLALALAVSAAILPTETARAQPPAVPAPANLRVTDLQIDRITVAWDPVGGAAGYSITPFGLDVGGSLPRSETTATTATVPNLVWDARYRITVRAFTPGLLYGDAAEIIVTTPTPDGYQRPTAPTNLRAERNVQGQIERFRWDAASGGHGPLTYLFFLDSPGFLPAGPVLRTSELSVSAEDLPVCDGCQYSPDQTIIVWVVAQDRRYWSPESNRVILTCCPF